MRTRFLATSAAVFGLFGLLSVAAAADRTVKNETDRTNTKIKSDRDDANREHKFDKKTAGHALRVSELCGMEVRNSAGKDLGDIKDLMLDLGERGRVRYAAISFGGFLGMGDKLFAVPWQALKFQHDATKDKSFVVFDVSQEKLKNSPGFDKDQWPDAADRKWMANVDKHYGIDVHAGDTDVHIRGEARNDRARDRNDKVADRGAERTDIQNVDPKRGHNEHNWRLHRASEAIGMKVRNGGGDKLGKVEDIVVAMGAGKIRYAALSFGGFLGIGDKLFAVPWDAVMVEYDADDKDFFVMFDTTKDQLDKAPGFDSDHWPNFGDETWAQGIHDFYKTHRREAKTTKRTRVE